jgi:hypothetical protein
MEPNYSVRKMRKSRRRRRRRKMRRRIRLPLFLHSWSSTKLYTYPQSSLRDEIKQNKN